MAERTILSAGMAISAILEGCPGLPEATQGQIYPVVTPEATLPYISYGMASLDATDVKTGLPARSAIFDILIYAESYAQACDLAEQVSAALSGYTGEAGGLYVRGLQVVGGEEYWANDAFTKTLNVRIRI